MKSLMRSVFLITSVCSVLVMLLKNSLTVSATSLWSLIILSLSLRIIWLLFFCLRVWIKGQIVLQNFLSSVNFFLQSFLKCSCTALLLMLTTLFLIISLCSPYWVLQECTGLHVATASLGRPVNLHVGNIKIYSLMYMFVCIHDITVKKDYNRKSWYQFIHLLLRILRYLETRHCTCWGCPEGFFEHCVGIYVSIRVA